MQRRCGKTRTNIIIFIIIMAAVCVGIFAVWKIDMTGQQGNRLGDAFTYNLTRLRQVDPELILYRETGRFKTSLKEATGIAVDKQNNIYVTGDKAILVFETSGRPLRQYKLMDYPRCLAVADDGSFFVGFKNHIGVFDKKGKLQSAWSALDAKALLTSVAVYEGQVFAADAGNRIVLHYDNKGKLLNKIGVKDPERDFPGFIIPSPYFDTAVSPDGLLRVSNPGRHNISAFTFAGEFQLAWGKYSNNIYGFCGCCNPIAFAILPGGNFVTCEKGLTRVKIYNPSGDFIGVVAGPESFIEHDRIYSEKRANRKLGALDVAADSRGRVIILDRANAEVRIFEKKKS